MSSHQSLKKALKKALLSEKEDRIAKIFQSLTNLHIPHQLITINIHKKKIHQIIQSGKKLNCQFSFLRVKHPDLVNVFFYNNFR